MLTIAYSIDLGIQMFAVTYSMLWSHKVPTLDSLLILAYSVLPYPTVSLTLLQKRADLPTQ